MNRQERRKFMKKGKFTREVSYSDLKDIEVAAQKEAVNKTFALCLNVSALALHDEFGFGKKRTIDFLTKVLSQFECIGDNLLDFDGVKTILEKEVGIIVEEKDGSVALKEKV